MQENEESINHDVQISFLYKSIDNLWETLKICDLKISFILVIVCIPFTKFNAVYDTIKTCIIVQEKIQFNFYSLFVAIFIITWVLLLYLSLRVLIAKSNPIDNIINSDPPKAFFPYYFFEIDIWDIFLKEKNRSKFKPEEHMKLLPTHKSDVVYHLTWEQIKLMYIVKYKIERSRYAYRLLFFWIILGGVLLMISKIKG
jgi:hypothetical protein